MILLFLLTTVISCQRAKDKGYELVDKSISKIKNGAGSLVKSGVKKAIRALTITKKTTFQTVFGKKGSLNVQEIDGVWVDSPPSFYRCFLKYKANKRTILNFISHQPTRLPAMSDESYAKTDRKEIDTKLDFIEKEFTDVRAQLNFFYEIRQLNNLEYYTCHKYPNAHLIVFHPATGTIYHYSENYWD